MSALFENAIDSLEFGIRTYLKDDHPTAHKHAIRDVFHAVELLLKERLSREHELLIYRDVDKPLSDGSLTVGLDETLARFENLGIGLPPSDVAVLKDLRRRRNRIEHHSFEADPVHKYVIGKALRFIYYFLQSHLSTSLEEEIDPALYAKAREAILSYEELLKEALKEVAERTTPRTKDDLASMPTSMVCPECNHSTLVPKSDRGDWCFFCAREITMQLCERCGEYAVVGESGLCDDCSDHVRYQ